MHRSGLGDLYDSSIFSSLRKLHAVFHSGSTHLHSHQRFPCHNSSFSSTPSPACIVCRFSDDGYSDWHEVISGSFDMYFSNSYWCWASLHVPLGHLYVFFGEMSVQIFCPFLWLGSLFFDSEPHELLVNFGDCFAETTHFHFRFRGFINKISDSL